MRKIFLLLGLVLITAACNRPSPHPRIYITHDKKDLFAAKLQSVDWAQTSYNALKSNVDPYVDRHQSDPEWIVSRMQMYWDTHYERIYVKGSAYSHGTGYAPVPTVKFAGHRDGATDYLMPSIEDTQPCMDEKGMYLQNKTKEGQPWEWVHPSKTGRMIGPMNSRIVSLAADAAFLYWYTGEEKYAAFAADIFLTYIKGMYYRREPFALEDYGNSHLMGLATFEVILDGQIAPLALSYDFLYPYLKQIGADMDMITEVFKRNADQQIMYGVPDNNWNIFQARHVTYLALALEDDAYYNDRRGKQYYLNEILNHTTIRQFALKEMIDQSFDPQTGLWLESATYSMSVCNDMLDVLCLIDTENSHILDSFPIMKKAVPATAEYLFPNGRVTAFGDAKYVPLNPRPFEMLIALYRKYGENEQEKQLTQALQKMINDGLYNRSENKSLFSLFFYVDKLHDLSEEDKNSKIPKYQDCLQATVAHLQHDTYYAPNVSWLMQRNGSDKQHGMAVTLVGAYGNHAHANGISMEMYAKGLLLAPESSFGETYGTRDNQEYYARFPAHNTVIVDGVSDYGYMRSNYPYRLLSSYPAHGNNLSPSDRVSFARVELTEPKTDALQQRLTGIVRTGETSGYVVDIFRSARKDKNDRKHEYFYHSIGQGIDINAAGRNIPLLPTRELSSDAGDMAGYNYFTNKKAAAFDHDFMARFRIELAQQDDVFVNMWMKGYPGRTVFTAEAPKSNALVKGAVPDELLGKPLPTLIVKQKGEAWNRPFVAVYHPYTVSEGASLTSVEYFGEVGDFIGIAVQSTDGTDYIFNSASGESVAHRDMKFKGLYAVVGETKGQLTNLFLGEGEILEKGQWRIRAKAAGTQVSLNHTADGSFALITSGDIQFTMPVSANKPAVLVNVAHPDKKISGEMQDNNRFIVDLPEGNYQIK
jgi:hypothetical protein